MRARRGPIVDKPGKDTLVENISAAALLGLLALLVASASFMLDGGEERKEKAVLVKLGSAKVTGEAIIVSDPAFRRVYPLQRKSRALYGAVLSIGDTRAVARVAAVFSSDGILDGVKVLDVIPSDAAYGRDGWFAGFVGKGGDDPFPASRAGLEEPDAVSGATESFILTSEAFTRASGRVMALAAAAQEGK